MPDMTKCTLLPAPRRTLILILALHFSAGLTVADTVIRTVGAGASCDYSELQPAIDFLEAQPPTDTKILRVAFDKIYSQTALTVEEASITIAGGFTDCEAETPSAFRSLLIGTGTSPVISVTSSGGAFEVRLQALALTQGGGQGGGGVRVTGPVQLVASDLNIYSNQAEKGGGIYLDGANLEIVDSTITSNTAETFGGGLFCQDGSVLSLGGTVFDGNLASRGGGARGSICTMIFEGQHDFRNNVASFGGGAIESSGQLTVRSSSRGSARFENNIAGGGSADSYGGALYIFAGDFLIQDALFLDNKTGSGPGSCGGAIANTGDATLRIESTLRDCDGTSCSVFAGNASVRGAALCSTSGQVEISRTIFREHGAPDGSPFADSLVFLHELSEHNLGVESVLATDNAVETIIDFQGFGQGSVRYSTFTDQKPGLAQVFRLVNPFIGHFRLAGSIVWEDAGVIIFDDESGSSVSAECLIVSENQSLPDLDYWTTADPRFRDPLAGDYRLAADSPAIDFCGADSEPAPEFDLDHDRRGADDPHSPDLGQGTFFDLGADELGPGGGELHVDGFESGDTSAWSSVVG